MNGIYNKTWRDLYVSTKVFAKINAISFKQARKVRDVMLNLYILLAALVWKTLTFKSDNHRREFPSRFSNRHNFWAISIVFYSPDCILMIKEGINTSPHSNTPNFHTFVRSTGNQVCVTRTKKQRSAPRMHGHSMCQPSRHVVGHRSWQSHHPKQLQGSVTHPGAIFPLPTNLPSRFVLLLFLAHTFDSMFNLFKHSKPGYLRFSIW